MLSILLILCFLNLTLTCPIAPKNKVEESSEEVLGNTEDGSENTEEGSENTDDGSENTEDGSENTEEGSENTEEVSSSESRGIDYSYLGNTIYKEPTRRVGIRVEGWNKSDEVNPEELGEYAEGDIVFPPNIARNGLKKARRWRNGVVPYEIAPCFTPKDLEMIKKAMSIYHNYTCIKFRPKVASDRDYLSIIRDETGCWSSVGRMLGRQELNLQSPGCTSTVGTPVHEMMHALGFVHEQSRWERDDYVTVQWENVPKKNAHNFKKVKKGATNGFGVPYDFRSVMHYSQYAFSENGKRTIVPKLTEHLIEAIKEVKEMRIGQREGFSRGDIVKINAMYGCKKAPPDKNDDDDDKIYN